MRNHKPTLLNLINPRLQPGEFIATSDQTVSTVSRADGKPLKRFESSDDVNPRLKPGVNERRVAWLLAGLLCLALSASALAADSQLESFFRRYLDERFALHPMEATQLGDHRFDDKLDDLSPAALERSLQHLKKTRAQLRKEIDRTKLSRDGQIDFDIFDHELESSIWLHENTKPFADNPRAYNEYISDSVFLLLTQSRLPKETNIANAIARMKQIPNVVAAAKVN